MTNEQFTIKNIQGGDIVTVDIECNPNDDLAVKLGKAVVQAVKQRANLQGADLYGANLYGADMQGANLQGADLLCMGDMRFIKTLHLDTWAIGYTHDTLQIGCQSHAIDLCRSPRPHGRRALAP